MQPRFTKGSFCHTKANAERKYKPLQFETYKADTSSPEGQCLASLLQKDDIDLGEVNVDWFTKARRGTTEREPEEADKKLLATPRHLSEPKEQPSPSLFSPEEPSSAPRHKRRRVAGQWNTSQATPARFPLLTQDFSPATPGISAFTPNQATGRAFDPSQASTIGFTPNQATGRTLDQSQTSSIGFSPFPSWNPTNKLATPAFMKQLFKTPSSTVRTPGKRIVTPDGDHSFSLQSLPQRLSISLGADLDDSNLSWTSSLATPPGSKNGNMIGTTDGNQSEEEMRFGVMPKSLHFSQDEIKPKSFSDLDAGCDVASQSMDNATQPLEMLRLSSLEEDGTSEGTLDSDVIGGEDGTDDDGEVVMGIPHPSKKQFSVDKLKLSANKSRKDSSLDALKKDVTSENLESREETVGDVKNKRNDFRNSCLKQKVDAENDMQESEDDTNTEVQMKSNNKESVTIVKHVKTESQNTDRKCTKVKISGVSSLSQAGNQSNIEETLAFLLATPPQRRLKLKRSSNLNKTNSNKESEKNKQLSDDGSKTVAEIKDRPQNFQSDLPVKVTSQDKEVKRKHKSEQERNGIAFDNHKADLAESKPETTIKQDPLVPHKTPKSEISQPYEAEEGSHKQLTPQKPGHSHSNVGEDFKPNVNTTPVINADNRDLFSQISPNLAEALCQAVDAASIEPAIPNTEIKQTKNENSSSTLGAKTAANEVPLDQEIEPTIAADIPDVTSKLYEAQKLPGRSRENQNFDLGKTSNSSCTTIHSKTPNPTQELPSTQENATAIFRMKPRATKKFYYPSPADTAPQQTPADVKKLTSLKVTPKLMAGTLHEVKEADESEMEEDTESGQTGKSSTPASRSSSGFVTFSSFVKSIEKGSPNTVYNSSKSSTGVNTPKSSANVKASPQPGPSDTTCVLSKSLPSKVKENLPPAVSAQASTSTSNRTTPVSGRSIGPLSLRSRRRLGRPNLPPPKRLKTISQSEDFHQKLNICEIDGKVDSLKLDDSKMGEDGKGAICKMEPSMSFYPTSASVETKLVPSKIVHKQEQFQTPSGYTSGFTTAANKAINIEPKNLLKAQGMMAEIYSQDVQLESDEVDNDAPGSSVTSGFKTGANKAISITPNSMQKARGIMEEIYSQEILSGLDSEKPEVSSSSMTMTSGFKTGANKNIRITSNSIQKARGMMAEIYSQDNQLATVSGKANIQGPSMTSGFKTAGNKAISINQNSLQKARGMMAEIDNQEIPLGSNKGKEQSTSMTSGFRTASNNAISITSNSLKSARSLMAEVYSQEIQFQAPAEKSKITDRADSMAISESEGVCGGITSETLLKTSMATGGNHPPTVGFSSASGRAIQISASSMVKAQKFMCEVEKELNNHDSQNKHSIEKMETGISSSTAAKFMSSPVDDTKNSFGTTSHLPTNVGFSSASGKAISISAIAMQKAQNLMKTVDNDLVSEQGSGRQALHDSHSLKEPATPLAVQLSSASGKALQISDASLEKAKSFMEEAHNTVESCPQMVQFASASGKAIKITDGAIDKARSFLSSGDSGISNSDTLQSIQFNSSSEVSNMSDHSFHKNDNVLSKSGDLAKVNKTPQVQQVSKPKKDYSKLPKGFRPFKPPSRAPSSAKSNKRSIQPSLSHRKVAIGHKHVSPTKTTSKGFDPNPKEVNETSQSMEKIGQSTSANTSDLCSATAVKVEPPSEVIKPLLITQDGFPDDGFSLSQAQREIQATENTELAYAFMQAEEDSFTQDQVCADDTRNEKAHNKATSRTRASESNYHQQQSDFVAKVPQAGDANDACLDESLIKEEDLHLIAKVEATHTGMQSSNMTNVSQMSHFETSLNQGFMNSQNSVCTQQDRAETVGASSGKNTVCSQQDRAETVDASSGKNVPYLDDNQASNLRTSAKHVLKEFQVREQQLPMNHQDQVGSAGNPKSEEPTKLYQQTVELQHDSVTVPNDTNVGGVSADKAHEFVGFQTGSGKRVTVSEESLKRAKHLFASAEEDPSMDENVQTVEGFQTASGNKVSVSEESLQRARELMNDDNSNQGTSSGEPVHGQREAMAPNHKFPVGFCTAGGNTVHVSDASLQMARETINGLVSTDDTKTYQSHMQKITTNDDQAVPSCTGFKTAGGTKVKVSEKSLQFAKNFPSEESNSSDSLSKQSNDPGSYVGFQTAGGTKVQVSEKYLQFAKNFPNEESNSSDSLSKQNNGAGSFAGFQTAGGTKVQVSEKSLEFTRNFLSEESDSFDRLPKQSSHAGGFAGFQTAAGTKVKVSEKALQFAKTFLGEESDSSERRTKPNNDAGGFVGFQTAGGTNVKVSEKSLQFALNFLNDGGNSSDSLPKQSNSAGSCAGFQTAGGSKVKVSEKSLKFAKNFLSDEGNNFDPLHAPDKGDCAGSNVGFQTASGNKVHISDDALQKAQQRLANEDSVSVVPSRSKPVESNVKCLSSSTKHDVGLETAGGHKAHISKQVLDKARQFLNDDENLEVKSDTQGQSSSLGKGFAGFQTASGTTFTASKKSLEKAGSMLSETAASTAECSTSRDDYHENLGTNKFAGFQTASGSTVTVSEESLERARSMFSGSDAHATEYFNTKPSNSVPIKFAGLQTASGSTVTVSEESLERACSLISKGEDHTSECSNTKLRDKVHGSNSVSAKYAGFHTAGGSAVNISDESLRKAKKFLSEGDSEASTQFRSPKPPMVGFQTASGNKVDISKEAIQKAQQFLNQHDVPSGESVKQPGTYKGFAGFTTAGGSKVDISEDALKKAQQFLNQDNISSDKLVKPPGTSKGFTGFTTAGGSKVDISKEALKKAQQFLNQDGLSSDESVKLPGTSKGFTGFTTAGGSKVDISEEALKKAQQFLNQDGKSSDESVNLPETSKAFTGFTTAGGSKVDISQEALKKAQQFLNQDGLSSDKSARLPGTSKGFTGFTTAGVSKVDISDDALKKAQQFLNQDNISSDESVKPPGTSKGFTGFTTAGGSKVDISKEALKKAQQFLNQDGLSSDESVNLPGTSKGFTGFTTAGGSKVDISKEALKKAHQFLNQDCMLSDEPVKPVEASKSFSGFTTAGGSKVEVSEQALKLVRGVIGDDEQQNCNGSLSHGLVPETGVSSRQPTQRTTDLSVSQRKIGSEKCNSTSSPATQLEKTHLASRGDGVVPQNQGSAATCGTGHASKTLRSKDSVAKKQFVPFRRQQPVSTSPASQWTDRSSVATQHNKSFKPYSTTPVPSVNPSKVSSNQGQTSNSPCTTSNSNQQTKVPSSSIHTEQIQVVPQMPLQPNQWGPKGTPFYKKASFQQRPQQHSRGKNQECTKSFQKYVPLGNSSKLTEKSDSKNSSKVTEKSNPESIVAGETAAVLDSVESDLQIQNNFSEIWKQARSNQMARIKAKKDQRIKPHPGVLFSKRQTMPRIKLYDMVDGQAPQTYSTQQLFAHGILPSTLHVNAASAESFKFKGQDHFSQVSMTSQDGVLLGDGGRLVFDDEGMVGKEEFYSALLDIVGVDPKFVNEDWVFNHYRWIVWKLAAMEVAYPQQFAARLLTPHWVMLQLKYRYDREIDNSQRSAVKKILERDDAPSRRLVLCVSAIHEIGSETPSAQVEGQDKGEKAGKNDKKPSFQTIELTDGWYCIKTAVDKALSAMIQKGRLFVGQKLCIFGAELTGSDDACNPLEVPANLMLRIGGNSTRPARYDAKLGLQRNPQPFRVSMSSLHGDGGAVGCLDVVVVRCYPIQYMEKHEDGVATFRNSKAEEKEAMKYGQLKQQRMEKLFNKIQKEFEKKQAKKEPRRKTRSRSSQRMKVAQIQDLSTGQEIYEALNDAYDPGSIEMHLTEKQMASLQNYQRFLQEKEQASLQSEFRKALEEQQEETRDRTVTPLLRVRLADCNSKSDPDQTCMMTVWRPTEEIIAYLTEGKRLGIYNVNVSPGRFSQSVNSKSVQLASTKRTRYKELVADGVELDEIYQARQPVPIWHLRQSSYQALYGEVDVVGLVVSVASGNAARNSTSNMQCVYIADSNAQVIAVKFWGGLQAHCLEDMIKPGIFICCSSLQYKPRDRFNTVAYLQATDMSRFTQTPKAEITRQALNSLKGEIKKPQEYIKTIEDSIDVNLTNPPTRTPTNMIPPRSRFPSPFLPPTIVTLQSASSKQTKHSFVAAAEAIPDLGNSDQSEIPLTREHSDLDRDKAQKSLVTTNISTEPHDSIIKSMVVSGVTSTVKKFIPYTGVKSNPVSQNTKMVTPSPVSNPIKQDNARQCYSDGTYAKNTSTSNSRSGNFVNKCFTPVTRPVNELRTIADGACQNVTGRQTRSNLFGTITESGNPVINLALTVPSSTPVRNHSDVHNQSFNLLDSTLDSQSSQLEEKRKDIARRTRLLGRIPSPPPLSPLPMSGSLRRHYRGPTRRTQTPEGKISAISSGASMVGQSGEKAPTHMTSPETDKVAPKEGRLYIDGLTASQREVQELMGMSLSCLDMEWSQQTPVKTGQEVPSPVQDIKEDVSDSPPMDLSYSEKETFGEHQETHKHVINGNKLQKLTSEVCNVDNTKSFEESSRVFPNTLSKQSNPTAAEQVTTEPNIETLPQGENNDITDSSQDSTSEKNLSSKKQTPTSRGKLKVAKRLASDTQQKPKQGKRFCTHGDLAVIDFDSLHGDERTSNKRTTRSSKRKQKKN